MITLSTLAVPRNQDCVATLSGCRAPQYTQHVCVTISATYMLDEQKDAARAGFLTALKINLPNYTAKKN